MRHFTFAFLMFLVLNVTISHGCNNNDIIHLQGLRNQQSNGVRIVDQAGTYKERRRAMTKYNGVARQRGCDKDPNDWTTEQDHMPPKSAINKAYQKKKSPLAKALYGNGDDQKMLAMTYLTVWHQGSIGTESGAATTGRSRGAQAVHKLIMDAIIANDVVLTYQRTIMATNSATITVHLRNFDDYTNKYISRLNVSSTDANTIRNWIGQFQTSQDVQNDPTFQELLNEYNAAFIPKN